MRPRILRRYQTESALVEYKECRTEADIEAAVALGYSDEAIDLETARTQQVDRNWPAFRYPPKGGPSSGKIFKSADEVPAGWLETPTGVDAPAASAKAPPSSPGEAVARALKAEHELGELIKAHEDLQARFEASRRECSGLREQIEAMQSQFQEDGQSGEIEKPASASRRGKKTSE